LRGEGHGADGWGIA